MEQNNRKLQGELVARGFSTDLAAEFLLPDYQPEIKRLLRVRAIPLPVDQYVGGSAAELSGAVEFQALYAAEDSSLWCVTKREDYRLSCPFEAGDFDLSEGLVCDVKTEIGDVSGRVLAPRKLTARCRVRTAVRLLADRPVPGAEIADDETVERLTDTLSCSRVLLGKSAPLTLTDEIPLDSSAPARVIFASAEVFPTEVKAGPDTVACQGDVNLVLLCAPEGAPEETPALDGAADCRPAALSVFELRRKIPFAVEIPVDGATDACIATAWGSCPELTVTVEETRVLCDVTLVMNARAVCGEEIVFTRGAYSTAALTEPVFCELPATKRPPAKNGNRSLSAAKELSEVGLRPGARVIASAADVSTLPPETSRGTYLLPGTLRVSVLAAMSDGDFATAEFDLPFRFEVPADEPPAPAASDSVFTPVSVKATVDGGRLLVEAELAAAPALSVAENVPALAALRTGERLAPRAADLTICYPAPGETLWSVAARYHAPLLPLAEQNGLAAENAASPDSLKGVRYLTV